MPFNAETYRANRWRKDAWQALAQARALKKRIKAGEAYDWELPRLAVFVQSARSAMHLYLIMRPEKPAARASAAGKARRARRTVPASARS